MPDIKKSPSETKKNLQQIQEPAQNDIVPEEAMHYIDSRGLAGVMVIIILEMATPIGMLFPTDAIVFGGGMYFSAKGNIRGGIWMIMALFSFAVVLGDLLGFRWGSLLSPKLQTMQDNWIFKKKYITMCEQYFNEYGNKTMLISKFLPIRSMIPLVAGVIMKPFAPFLLQSILSAILWVGSLLGISYFIIWLIPEAANHIGLLTFLFVVLPQVVSVWYMILPMMRKYEARLVQASDNLHHIAQEVSMIGAQFAAIGHEMKEIVTKISHEDHVGEQNAPLLLNNPQQTQGTAQDAVGSIIVVNNPTISSDIPMIIPTPVVPVAGVNLNQTVVENSSPST